MVDPQPERGFNEAGERRLTKSKATDEKSGSLVGQEYDSQGWLKMRPDVTREGKVGGSTIQTEGLGPWFADEDPTSLPTVTFGASPSTVSGSRLSYSSNYESVKRLGIKQGSPGANSHAKPVRKTLETLTPKDSFNSQSNMSEEVDSRHMVREMAAVLEKLMYQNQGLVLELERRKSVESSHSYDGNNHDSLSKPKTRGENEVRNLRESNLQLEGELFKSQEQLVTTKKELEAKEMELWQQDYELRDHRTELEKLRRRLVNWGPIDDMDSFAFQVKTPREEMQEESIGFLKEENKKLERKIKDLEARLGGQKRGMESRAG